MELGHAQELHDYRFITTDKVRYSDTDRQGHVNNAVFSAFLETGRVEILYDLKNKLSNVNCSFVIVSLKLDFLDEITWPGEIKIGTQVGKIGNSSITIEQGLFQNNKCVALAETIIVHINDTTRKSEKLSDKVIIFLMAYRIKRYDLLESL